MRKITVEADQLDACAVRMEEENQNYMRNTEELFNAVDTMSAAWQGKENAAFTSKIGSYHSDCRQLSLLCTQYIEFLRNSSRAYRETQDELTSQASHLA
ncbi:MAG: WXG100 family type VII secretion target [Erysipelotrichaceae bacterium]|nr:WXG100 family type VII secretion target [Erysipelotrichaceae bacterium]